MQPLYLRTVFGNMPPPVKITEDPGERWRKLMLVGMALNALAIVACCSGLISMRRFWGPPLFYSSFALIAFGTIVYYSARFMVWLKTGKWDNTGLGRSRSGGDD